MSVGVTIPGSFSPDDVLRRCYQAALNAADPAAALNRALARLPWPSTPQYLIGIGKGAGAMAAAANKWAVANGGAFMGGLVVTTEALAGRQLSSPFQLIAGEHPLPGPRSVEAATTIQKFIDDLPAEATVHVLISGGASALIASPLPGLREEELFTTFAELLGSGLPIGEMNALRKRISRWSGGRLAAALAPRTVHAWILSDVPGDDVATIASGPCHGDPWTANDVAVLLQRRGLADQLPPAVLHAMKVETLKPGDPQLGTVHTTIVASNQSALDGIVSEAGKLGCPQRRLDTPIAGEAREAGRNMAIEVMQIAREWESQNQVLVEEGHADRVRPLILYQGGETTVTVVGDAGTGGRSQELALAAAEMLEVSPHPVSFLAAGTDGHDGNSDAAGAVVNTTTWDAIKAAGLNPDVHLARHDSYAALRGVDALIVTGETGGNVMDVVIAVVTSP